MVFEYRVESVHHQKLLSCYWDGTGSLQEGRSELYWAGRGLGKSTVA